MTTALQLIEELERLMSEAAALPWVPRGYGATMCVTDSHGAYICDRFILGTNRHGNMPIGTVGEQNLPVAQANRDLIAAAVNAIPTLAATIRELVQENADLETACKAALYLVGKDSDRAAIGERPWLPFDATCVPNMLRVVIGLSDVAKGDVVTEAEFMKDTLPEPPHA